MNETQKQIVGGVEWIIGAPNTAERVTMRYAGQSWPIDAVKAASEKGMFWLCSYQPRDWHPRKRPFEHPLCLALDDRGRVLVQAPDQYRTLWTLTTGKSWKDLPDCFSTASQVDDQPSQSRQHGQRTHAQPSQGRPAPRPEAQRQSAVQRVAKALGLIKDDTSTHGTQHDDQ